MSDDNEPPSVDESCPYCDSEDLEPLVAEERGFPEGLLYLCNECHEPFFAESLESHTEVTDEGHLVGQRIVDIQPMDMDDYFPYSGEGLNLSSPILVLENGVRLYASRDPEGNGPGALLGVDPVRDPGDIEQHFMVFLTPDDAEEEEAKADD